MPHHAPDRVPSQPAPPPPAPRQFPTQASAVAEAMLAAQRGAAEGGPPIPVPKIHQVQRCRLIAQYVEVVGGDGDGESEPTHFASTGWGRINGNGWVDFLDDEMPHWQSWPPHVVITVEWLTYTVEDDAP